MFAHGDGARNLLGPQSKRGAKISESRVKRAGTLVSSASQKSNFVLMHFVENSK